MAGTFALDISRFCKSAKSEVKGSIQKITFEAFKRIILRNPVLTGRSRANWGVTIGQPNTTYQIEAEDKSGSATLTTAANGVQSWERQGSIFMTNNLAYIIPLEYGSSQQAPGGMVRLTIAEMQAWCANPANVKASIGSLRQATVGR